ncbi:MAG TPA: SIMPL domain-containing protein [Myxococcota bacterium]|nr:SIMPL domain-containing protein [Myxococcota bacterium]
MARADVLVASLVLAAGIAAGGYFIGQTAYNAKVAINTAEVKGLAERRVEADRAHWKIEYTVSGADRAEISKLYERSEADQKQIVALLLEHGFEQAEIRPGVIRYEQLEFRDLSQKLVEVRHRLVGAIEVETEKVKLLSTVRAKLNELVARGLDVQNHPPAYYFTKLNEIKPAMLQEATQNARIAANEFAENAGVEVGGIRSARQGEIIIRDVGESYGDTAKLEKDVRVVTAITFYLTR